MARTRYKVSVRSSELTFPRRASDMPRVNRQVALTAESYGGENEIYELNILRHIKTANPDHPGHKHVLCLLDEFRHAEPHGVHVCLVFEAMGEDLVTLARRYSDQKLPVHLVKQITRLLLLGLDYLHDSCKVVHTDQWFHFTLSRFTYQPVFPSRYPTAEHFDLT